MCAEHYSYTQAIYIFSAYWGGKCESISIRMSFSGAIVSFLHSSVNDCIISSMQFSVCAFIHRPCMHAWTQFDGLHTNSFAIVATSK